MPENDVIITKDLNEVARIHSNSKYSNWKFIWAGHTNSLLIPTKISEAIRRARKLKNII